MPGPVCWVSASVIPTCAAHPEGQTGKLRLGEVRSLVPGLGEQRRCHRAVGREGGGKQGSACPPRFPWSLSPPAPSPSASDSLLPGRGVLLGGKQHQLRSTQQETEAQIREGPRPRPQSHRVNGSLETRAQDLTPHPALPLPLQWPWPTRRDPQPSEVHQTLSWVAVTVLDRGGRNRGNACR